MYVLIVDSNYSWNTSTWVWNGAHHHCFLAYAQHERCGLWRQVTFKTFLRWQGFSLKSSCRSARWLAEWIQNDISMDKMDDYTSWIQTNCFHFHVRYLGCMPTSVCVKKCHVLYVLHDGVCLEQMINILATSRKDTLPAVAGGCLLCSNRSWDSMVHGRCKGSSMLMLWAHIWKGVYIILCVIT